MVGGHHVVAQLLAELVGEPLGQPAGVDEHEGRVVLADQVGDAVDDVAHLLGRGHGLELALGQLERQVEVALVAGVDDGARRRARRRPHSRSATSEIGRWVADRPMRWGRAAHACSSRSSVSARCEPRLSRATAWISSTMTVSTVRQHRRGCGPR